MSTIDDRGKKWYEAAVWRQEGLFHADVVEGPWLNEAKKDVDFLGEIGVNIRGKQECKFRTLSAAVRYSFRAHLRGITDASNYIPCES